VWIYQPCAEKTNSLVPCYEEVLSEYCLTYYVEVPGDGDGGTTGGEGGGTPPDCNPNPTEGNRISSNLPACGPGWEPVPIEDEPPPEETHNPCDTLNKYSQTPTFRLIFQLLKDSVPTRRENILIYNNLFLPSSPTNPIQMTNGVENQFSVYPPNESIFIGCWGWNHNHFADEDSAALNFTPADVNIMADQIVRRSSYFQIDYTKFMIGMVGDSNTQYILMVDDLDQFTSWSNTYKNEELISYVFSSSKLVLDELPLSVAETEKRFLKAMQFSGLKLFRGSNDFSTWTPLKLDSTGNNVIPTNCL
ncbi:MAG: hypothetical protein KDC06_12030, partial [Chitinophagaceae bacterium]|nr:hypothetical protein [Chitinophagaceae bacterium]